ncbi:MAG: hypothetical protein ACXWK3_21970, partial [Reyranella sp.]
GSPSLSLMRRNGFSPVRINLCGSATLIFISPCSNQEAGDYQFMRVCEAHLFFRSRMPAGRNRNGRPAFQSVEEKPFGRP